MSIDVSQTVTATAEVRARASLSGMCDDRNRSGQLLLQVDLLVFSLSVSLYECSILICIFRVALNRLTTGRNQGTFQQKYCSFGNVETPSL